MRLFFFENGHCDPSSWSSHMAVKKSVSVNMLGATDALKKIFCRWIMILVHKVQLDNFHRMISWSKMELFGAQ